MGDCGDKYLRADIVFTKSVKIIWGSRFYIRLSELAVLNIITRLEGKGAPLIIKELFGDRKGENNMEKLTFYPKHPSGVKTHVIETKAMPRLEQSAPFAVKTLCDEFRADANHFYERYVDKRFEVTGIAKKVGPDIHNKPSIELSDSVNGQTYALVIFPAKDHYEKVSVGNLVTVRANYLVMSNSYGVVMKFSELISIQNDNEKRRK